MDSNASPDELARAMLLYRFCGQQMQRVQRCIDTKGQNACQNELAEMGDCATVRLLSCCA